MKPQQQRQGAQVIRLDHGGRVPPHDEQLEQALVCAMLTEGGRVIDDAGAMQADEFYSEVCRTIWACGLAMHERRERIDFQTVANELLARDRLTAVGGFAALARLVDTTPAIANVDAYALRIRNLARRRRMILVAAKLAAEGYATAEESTTDYLERSEAEVFAVVRDRDEERSVVSAAEGVGAIWRSIQATHEGRAKPELSAPITTGLSALDDALAGGMRDGQLVIVAARPGHGKSALSGSIILKNSVEPEGYTGAPHRPVGCAVFSLEMQPDEWFVRWVASDAGVSGSTVRRAVEGTSPLPDLVYSRTLAACDRLHRAPVWIEGKPGLTLAQIRSTSRRLKSEWDRACRAGDRRRFLVIVDYLQLMRSLERRSGNSNREQEVAEFSRGLKELAKELCCPVVALSQLNRSVESRPDKRPQLSDLRESGAIEQDADIVIFLSRPWLYDRSKSPELTLVDVAKQRGGGTSDGITARFIAQCTRFEDMPPEQQPLAPPFEPNTGRTYHDDF